MQCDPSFDIEERGTISTVTVSTREDLESAKNIECLPKSTNHPIFSDWKIIAYGQIIALYLACCSISSATLQNLDGIKNMPLFQISFAYLSLGSHLIYLSRQTKKTILHNAKSSEGNAGEATPLIEDTPRCNGGRSFLRTSEKFSSTKIRLHSPWYFYALISFLDVQANFCVVLSFRYTAVVNSSILTSLSIISVMTTSRFLLKKLYNQWHFIGAFLCVFGASMIVSMDLPPQNAETSREGGMNHAIQGSSRVFGDVFAIIAAFLFGLNDTLAEYIIQNSTRHEYLGMLGIFGFTFSLAQSFFFENEEILNFFCLLKDQSFMNDASTGCDHLDLDIEVNFVQIFGIWVGYVLFFYIFYASASNFLTIADATMLSLSLQVSNVWTMAFSIFSEKVIMSPLFFGSVCMIIFGVWLYERGSAP